MGWFASDVWPTMYHTFIGGCTAAVVAGIVIAPTKKALHSMGTRIGSAIDSLDPDVPVGLTKQLGDMQDQLEALNSQVKGTLVVRPEDPHAPVATHSH